LDGSGHLHHCFSEFSSRLSRIRLVHSSESFPVPYPIEILIPCHVSHMHATWPVTLFSFLYTA
jgi:hypothetical protein